MESSVAGHDLARTDNRGAPFQYAIQLAILHVQSHEHPSQNREESQSLELVPIESGLPQNAPQSSRRDLTMTWYRCGANAFLGTSYKLHMAPTRTHFNESRCFQFSFHLAIRQGPSRHRLRPLWSGHRAAPLHAEARSQAPTLREDWQEPPPPISPGWRRRHPGIER